MKRPSFLTYVLANPLVLLLAWGTCLYLGYRAFLGEVSAVAAILAFLAAGSASNAYGQVDRYKLWQKEWEGYEDAPKAPSYFQRRPILQIAVIGGIWIGIYLGATGFAHERLSGPYNWLFWCGLAVILTILAWRLRRFVKLPAKAPAKADHVTLRIAPPAQSPDARAIPAALPDYCRDVFDMP